jgi:biopolymer transport protein ExbB/TolQ
LQAIRGRNAGSRSIMASTFRSKVFVRIAVVRNIANSLVLLGLIGTVVGFIIALSGVDPATVGDVTSVSPMVSRLLNGMSVALYTTLVGGVLNLWLSVNYQLLAAGAATMLTTAISLGEVHARD